VPCPETIADSAGILRRRIRPPAPAFPQSCTAAPAAPPTLPPELLRRPLPNLTAPSTPREGPPTPVPPAADPRDPTPRSAAPAPRAVECGASRDCCPAAPPLRPQSP